MDQCLTQKPSNVYNVQMKTGEKLQNFDLSDLFYCDSTSIHNKNETSEVASKHQGNTEQSKRQLKERKKIFAKGNSDQLSYRYKLQI